MLFPNEIFTEIPKQSIEEKQKKGRMVKKEGKERKQNFSPS